MCPRMDCDPVMMSEPLREVARHGVAEVVTANEDVNLVDMLREEQRGLPSRVGASYHDCVLADACPCLEFSRGVVDAATFELGNAGGLQAPVLDAAGDHDGSGGDIVVVIEPDLESVRAARQPR